MNARAIGTSLTARLVALPVLNPAVLLVALPLAWLVVDGSWAFTDSSYTDPWYYFGYYQFLPQHLQDFPFYYGSRLPWLVPGWLAYMALPPLAANYLLHVGYHLVGTLALYALVARTLGARTGLVCAALLAAYSPFLQAVGWDYADGPAIAYFLLTLLLMTLALEGKNATSYMVAAGATLAMLVFSNVYWLALAPAFAVYLVTMAGRAALRQAVVPVAAGGLAVTLVLGGINALLVAKPFFFMPSLRTAGVLVRDGNPWWLPFGDWLPMAPYMALPLVGLGLALLSLVRRRRVERPETAFRLTFVSMCLVLLVTQVLGQASLQLHYYASALIPGLFLAIAVDLRRPLARLSGGQFGALAALAVVAPMLPFSGSLRPQFITLQTGLLLPPLLMIVGAVVLAWLGRGRFLPLALAVVVWSVANVAIMDGRVIDLQSRRDKLAEFEAIDDAARAIRAANPARSSRVWYDQTSALAYVFEATASTHLAGFEDIERAFPAIGQPDKLRGGRVAVLSADPRAGAEAESALQARGLSGQILDQRLVQHGQVGFTVTTLEVSSGP